MTVCSIADVPSLLFMGAKSGQFEITSTAPATSILDEQASVEVSRLRAITKQCSDYLWRLLSEK